MQEFSQEDIQKKANVRNGAYWLWAHSWFYGHVDESDELVDENVAKLIGWFDGSLAPPAGVDVQQSIVDSGDVPLCAMHVSRPDGELSAVSSYAPPNPCNGWYEATTTGSSTYQACNHSSDCSRSSEVCRFGYCEAY